MYEPHGGTFKESTKTLTLPSGAFLKFRFMDNDRDAEKQQGSDYTDCLWEELGNFPSPSPVMKMKGVLRSARGIPCQMYGTGNPGGPGQSWIKARYIDPAPPWTPIKEIERVVLPNGEIKNAESTRIYIPARVTDNQILLKQDPGYIANLTQSGSEQLVKAWLFGDFNAVDGQFFDEWDPQRHVLPPAEIPAWWTRGAACDWGSYRPFCVLWFAVASEDYAYPGTNHIIPKGALVFYKEYYGIKVKMDGTIAANTGLKMYAEEVAQGILQREQNDGRPSFRVMDPSAFARDGGPSIAERMYASTGGKVAFRRADNSRTGVRGPMGGWDQVRARLAGEPSQLGRSMQRPMLYVTTACHHLIRTLPSMQHDPDRPEDIDTTSEDHCVDTLRYACLSRPYLREAPTKPRQLRGLQDMTLEDLWYHQDKIAQSDGRI